MGQNAGGMGEGVGNSAGILKNNGKGGTVVNWREVASVHWNRYTVL